MEQPVAFSGPIPEHYTIIFQFSVYNPKCKTPYEPPGRSKDYKTQKVVR